MPLTGNAYYPANGETPEVYNAGFEANAAIIDANENSINTASPFNYGAVGDGVADDKEAVQACFSASTDVDLTGGIFLCGDIVMQEGTHVHGGKLKGANGESRILNLSLRSTVTGVAFETTDVTTAIYVVHDANTDLQKQYWRVSHCSFINCFNGISVEQNTRLAGALIDGCDFYGIESHGVFLSTYAEYVTISNCVFLECAKAIRDKGGNAIINNNQITGSTPTEDTFSWSATTVGIEIEQGSNDGHGVITGNNVNHCKAHGLIVGNIGIRTMQVANNHFIDSNIKIGNAGIQLANNRFTTSSFDFTDTAGTILSQSVLDATPTIAYAGACDVSWVGVMTTDGATPTMPLAVLYNGTIKNNGGALPIFTAVGLTIVSGSSEFYVVGGLGLPAGASDVNGFVKYTHVTDAVSKREYRPNDSDEIWVSRETSINNWSTWVQVF